ncbi:Disulfide bond formation protein B [Candidatus Hepatincola sp. Av]
MKNLKEYHYLIHYIGNIIGVGFVIFILLAAFSEQLLLGELACPLCLLQRMAYVAVGVAFSMNLTLGIRSSHYGMAILAALAGILIATRQTLLHILPNDPGFGSTIMNIHVYTWNIVIFFIIVAVTAVALHFGYAFNTKESKVGKITKKIALTFIMIFGFLILANLVSVFLECGLSTCPDDPIEYKLFN